MYSAFWNNAKHTYKNIMDVDMFCCIHERGELVNGDNGIVKYIGDQTICIEIDKHMLYD